MTMKEFYLCPCASQFDKAIMNEIKRDIHLANTLFLLKNSMFLFACINRIIEILWIWAIV